MFKVNLMAICFLSMLAIFSNASSWAQQENSSKCSWQIPDNNEIPSNNSDLQITRDPNQLRLEMTTRSQDLQNSNLGQGQQGFLRIPIVQFRRENEQCEQVWTNTEQ